jgi:hypothetical protein
MKVRDYRDLATEDVDRIILATFDKPQVHLPDLLALGLPPEKLLLLGPARRTNGAR